MTSGKEQGGGGGGGGGGGFPTCRPGVGFPTGHRPNPAPMTGRPLRASRKQRPDPRADLRAAGGRKEITVLLVLHAPHSPSARASLFLHGHFVRRPWNGVKRRGKQPGRRRRRRTVALVHLQLPVQFTPVFLTQVNLQQLRSKCPTAEILPRTISTSPLLSVEDACASHFTESARHI